VEWARPGILLTVLFSFLAFNNCGSEMKPGVAAEVNGRQISTERVSNAFHSSTGIWETSEEAKRVIEIILDRLIEDELILAEAEALGLSISGAELERAVREVKGDYPDQSFEDMLLREYIHPAEWREDLRRSLLIGRASKTIAAPGIGQEPEKSFSSRLAEQIMFAHPALVKFDYLTFATQKEAAKALRRLRSGRAFQEVAESTHNKERSSASTPSGWINPEDLPEEIARAALKTKPGQVSDVVKSDYGYLILKVLDVKPPERMSSEKIIDLMRRRYQAEQEEKFLLEWLKKARSKASIKINPQLFSLVLPREDTVYRKDM